MTTKTSENKQKEKPELITPVSDILSKETKREEGIYPLKDLVEDLKNSKKGLKTGYKVLDEEISLHEGDYVVVAGRPSHGKTTTKLNILLNQIEIYPEYSFAFYAYEGNLKSIALKIIQILSGHHFKIGKQKDQFQGYVTKEPSNKIDEIERALSTYDSYIKLGRLKLFASPYTVQDLSESIIKLSKEQKMGSVFIDYIQKIKNKERFGSRQLELQKTSEIILETANKTNIPIVLGAQLGRDNDHRDKVKLENLRECGDIEQDASIVLGIHNSLVAKKEESGKTNTKEENDFTITILKNRDGDVGDVIPLNFNRSLLKITDGEV